MTELLLILALSQWNQVKIAKPDPKAEMVSVDIDGSSGLGYYRWCDGPNMLYSPLHEVRLSVVPNDPGCASPR